MSIAFISNRQLQLSSTDVNTVKASTDRNLIGSRISHLWDRLMDYICSTNRVEAKQYLFDMFSQTTTDLNKIESFKALAQLVGDGFQGKFEAATDDDGNETYRLTLADSAESCFSLIKKNYPCNRDAILQKLKDDLNEGNALQLNVDIGRGHYSIGGIPLTGDTIERQNKWDERLTELRCSDAQKQAIASVSNQTTFGSIMSDVEKIQVGDLPMPPTCFEQDNSIVEYNIDRDESGVIVVQGRNVLDVAASGNTVRVSELSDQAETNVHWQNSTDIRFRIDINAQGELTLTDLRYLCHRDVPEDTDQK